MKAERVRRYSLFLNDQLSISRTRLTVITNGQESFEGIGHAVTGGHCCVRRIAAGILGSFFPLSSPLGSGCDSMTRGSPIGGGGPGALPGNHLVVHASQTLSGNVRAASQHAGLTFPVEKVDREWSAACSRSCDDYTTANKVGRFVRQ